MISSDDYVDVVNEMNYCGLLLPGNENPLQPCLDALGSTVVDSYYDSCKIDVSVLVESPDEAREMVCGILETMLRECTMKGAHVNPVWRKVSSCGKLTTISLIRIQDDRAHRFIPFSAGTNLRLLNLKKESDDCKRSIHCRSRTEKFNNNNNSRRPVT